MSERSDLELDDLLRRAFAGAVADDGFTRKLIRALPPRPPPRSWPLPLAAAIGGVLSWAALSPSPLWHAAAHEWLANDIGAASVLIGALLLGISLLGCAWALDETA